MRELTEVQFIKLTGECDLIIYDNISDFERCRVYYEIKDILMQKGLYLISVNKKNKNYYYKVGEI